MAKGKVLLVTSDKALPEDLSAALAKADFEVAACLTASDAAARLDKEEHAAVVVDSAHLQLAERDAISKLHRERGGFPLLLLDTLTSLTPTEALPLRRLAWPFPPGFPDQVRAADRPVVFLVDQTLAASRAVPMGLAQAGIQTLIVDSVFGLIEMLAKSAAPEDKPKAAKGFWGKISGGEDEEVRLSKIAVAPVPGGLAEAEAFDARLREAIPKSACYLVSSLDSFRAAVKAVREKGSSLLMREQTAQLPAILAEATQAVAARRERERLLILDNNKPSLEAYAQALIAAGYEVATTTDAEGALKMASVKGAYHLVVIGTALVFAKLAGKDLAERLRAADPDLRIIFMVEPYPVETVMKRFSAVVELGIDDALLKPVEPSRLLFATQRALERRFLLLENARLLLETQDQKGQLERVNGFQKKFFATVAHDVKNPLTAILGYSEMLGARLKDMPNELRCASHILSAAKTLNTLISDLVDLAAIESGKLRVNMGVLDVGMVVMEVKSRIDVVAQQRKIDFQVIVPPQVPPLYGDPARIGQVVQNLCTNAIQYTKEGGKVAIRVDLFPQQLTVSVIDTGIGIKKEDLPRVFERFFQTQEAQAMRKAGFGLGLKISREIVQMHGGDISIESEFGKGSRFFFNIPYPKPGQLPVVQAAAAPAPAAAPLPAPALARPAAPPAPAPAAPSPAPAPAALPAAPAPAAAPPAPAPAPAPAAPPPAAAPPAQSPPGTPLPPPITIRKLM